MDAHQVLVRARNIIADETSWCQGSTRDEGGRVCALGAITLALDAEFLGHSTAVSPQAANHPASDALAWAMGVQRATDSWVGKWNDTHAHAEVLAAFDRAITATAPEPDTAFLNNAADPVAA